MRAYKSRAYRWNGEKITARQLAKKLGVALPTACNYLNRGLSSDKDLAEYRNRDNFGKWRSGQGYEAKAVDYDSFIAWLEENSNE